MSAVRKDCIRVSFDLVIPGAGGIAKVVSVTFGRLCCSFICVSSPLRVVVCVPAVSFRVPLVRRWLIQGQVTPEPSLRLSRFRSPVGLFYQRSKCVLCQIVTTEVRSCICHAGVQGNRIGE